MRYEINLMYLYIRLLALHIRYHGPITIFEYKEYFSLVKQELKSKEAIHFFNSVSFDIIQCYF